MDVPGSAATATGLFRIFSLVVGVIALLALISLIGIVVLSKSSVVGLDQRVFSAVGARRHLA